MSSEFIIEKYRNEYIKGSRMEKIFEYGGRHIPYHITYSSRRKTINITIDSGGQVNITAPTGISEQEIIVRVKTKGQWILTKLAEVQARGHYPAGKQCVNGESFLVMGEDCQLQIILDHEVKTVSVKLRQGKLLVTSPTEDGELLKPALESWYRNKAREAVQERLNYYQPLVGVSPVRVRIKEQKRRWGSCSSKGNLNFNWRVAMAPLPVLDYIIVHELCHLIHLNHSREFWDLVGSILPEYKKGQDWLKKNGAKLVL